MPLTQSSNLESNKVDIKQWRHVDIVNLNFVNVKLINGVDKLTIK